MSNRDLTLFSYAILALIGEGGAGAHDLVASMRRGRAYWSASPRHFYSEPKRLAGLGYLDTRTEPGITRERTVYSLTASGRESLKAWIAEPSPFPRIQNEALVRLVAGYLVADGVLLESLRGLRADTARVAAEIEEAERFASSLPERARYLGLVHSLGRRLVATVDDWLDEAERELS